MIRSEHLIESTDKVLALTPVEASALRTVGKRLVSKKSWWGGTEEEEDVSDRSIIRVEPRGGGLWAIRVADAVGVLSVGTLQLVIEPKIPMPHLLYLLGRSGEFPRLDEQRAATLTSPSLWELVATWCVEALETVMRRDLVRDYVELSDTLATARGRIDVYRTARLYYGGQLAVACEFDDFGFDTALNRVLKAASRIIACSSVVKPETRRRASRILARLDEVGTLRFTDLTAVLDRRTGHYRDAFALARHVLQHVGRDLAEGGEVAWTFLIRTPEMVEAGVRRVLTERLGERVTKEGRQLRGSRLRFNPDLVCDRGVAIADVKYKLSMGEWTRADLYQIIAFAEAFGSSDGAIVRFRASQTPRLPDLVVGSKRIREVTWIADASEPPAAAAEGLVDDVTSWLSGCVGMQ